ncbi:MAG: hypothetical protein A2096_10415 [Spirochaetes bacterium GWF1_41_5]|nr:MAG: hypothetical protein A2096_10415 [Spirochaetes bacterium GWF1_41_5]
MKGEAEIIHIHNHFTFRGVLDVWKNSKINKPLVLGEWWIGTLGVDFRLTSVKPAYTYEDWLKEQGRLYRIGIEEHRMYGASTMPFQWPRYSFASIFATNTKIDVPAVSDDAFISSLPGKAVKPEQMFKAHQTLPSAFNPGFIANAPHYIYNNELTDQIKAGFAPVMVTFENRSGNFLSGEIFSKDIVVLNDARNDAELVLLWNLSDIASVNASGKTALKLAPGEQYRYKLDIPLPAVNSVKAHKLTVSVHQNNKIVSENILDIRIFPGNITAAIQKKIYLYDPEEKSKKMLEKTGAPYIFLKSFDITPAAGSVLIIGEEVPYTSLVKNKDTIEKFFDMGINLVVLKQARYDYWLPFPLEFESAVLQTMACFTGMGLPEPENKLMEQQVMANIEKPLHPVFSNLPEGSLCYFRAKDHRVSDDVYLKPTGSAMNINVLAAAKGYPNMALAEVFYKKSKVILCQFNLLDNIEIDPAARQLLCNIIKSSEVNDTMNTRAYIAGQQTYGYLKNTLKAEVNLYDKNINYNKNDLLIIGSEIDLNNDLLSSVESFTKNSNTVLVLPRQKNFSMAGKSFVLLDAAANSFPINSAGPQPGISLLSGLNAHELINRSGVIMNHYFSADLPKDVKPLASAYWTHSAMRGKAVSETIPGEKPFGWAMLGLAQNQGKIILCQLPILENSPKMISTCCQMFTTLGVKIAAAKAEITPYHCLQAKDMKIDGKLDDWISDIQDEQAARWRHAKPITLNEMNIIINKGQKGNTDSSGIAYCMYDEKYFYMAAAIIDDNLNWPAAGDTLWNYDSLQVRLGNTSFSFALDRNKNTPLVDRENFPLTEAESLSCKVIIKKENSLNYITDLRLLGGDTKELLSSPGYIIEAAIPIEIIFTQDKPQSGSTFRLSAALNDNDGGTARQGQLVSPKEFEFKNFSTYTLGIFE